MRGANMIVAFTAEKGVTLSSEDVATQQNSMDDDEIDIKITPEMVLNVAGGSKCAQ